MSLRGDFFREVLRALIRRPGYKWGGRLLDAMDCSGFVTMALFVASERRIDWRLTHNTDKLWTLPKVEEKDLLPGDLILYWGESSKGPDDVSHVMVYVGEGQCVGMAWGGPSDVDPEASRASGKVPMVKNIHYRADVAGFVRLPLD